MKIKLKNEFIEAIFVDNEKFSRKHRNGYNGIASLKYIKKGEKHSRKNFFVDFYAGLNLEHYFNEKNHTRDDFFHPRRFPMTIEENIEGKTVRLHQEPFEPWFITYEATFTMPGSNLIDFQFKMVPMRDNILESRFLGVFWASYINKPEKIGVHYSHRPESGSGSRWRYYETTAHGEDSTICRGEEDKALKFDFDPPRAWLFMTHADFYYEEPVFYGINDGIMFLLMFKESDNLRFAHSPSGGGKGCPAWDFFTIYPDPKPDEEYTLEGRVVLKPFVSEDDALQEYMNYKKN
ncbi:MAG: hypothetical protein ACFFCS_16335 [Candidatus Hodarchaeota archaeon]